MPCSGMTLLPAALRSAFFSAAVRAAVSAARIPSSGFSSVSGLMLRRWSARAGEEVSGRVAFVHTRSHALARARALCSRARARARARS